MTLNHTATCSLATLRPYSRHVLSTRLSTTLQTVLQRWALMRLERRTVQALSELDDGQLADIGLSRREIRSAAAGRPPAHRIG